MHERTCKFFKQAMTSQTIRSKVGVESNGGERLGDVALSGDVVGNPGEGRDSLEVDELSLGLGLLLEDGVSLHSVKELLSASRVLDVLNSAEKGTAKVGAKSARRRATQVFV